MFSLEWYRNLSILIHRYNCGIFGIPLLEEKEVAEYVKTKSGVGSGRHRKGGKGTCIQEYRKPLQKRRADDIQMTQIKTEEKKRADEIQIQMT